MEFTPTEVILQRAKAAASCPALRDTEAKNRALAAMAQELRAEAPAILAENAADLEAARGKVSDVMLDRLALNEARLEGMAAGIEAVAALPDPVGRTLDEFVRPDGLRICKRSVPMGVIAIIYESRPNVTSDAAALALKSGNVCVLRSGREAYRSAAAITASSNLSKEDIDKAVKEAEQFAAEDKKHKDEVDTHNAADQVIYQTEKTLNELGDKVSESEKAPVQAALEDLKTKNKGNDIEAIKAATDAVQKAFYAISEKLYQQAAPQQGEANNGGAANNGGHDDGVVDADYEEVKD